MTEHNVFEVRSMIEAAVTNDLFFCDNCNRYSKNKGSCKCGAPKRRIDLEEMVRSTPYIEYVFNNNMSYLHAEVTIEFNRWIVTINTSDRVLETHDAKYGDERISVLNDVCNIVDDTCKKMFFERMRKVLTEVF